MGHYCLYITLYIYIYTYTLFTYSFLLIHMNLPPYVLRHTEKNLTAPQPVFTVLAPD